jgi:fatty acid desaturase
VRGIAEHFALPDETGTDATRHIDANWLERFAIAPLNINYHLAHHLFPGIPYYNLPEMTAILFANPEFAARAHRSRGYLSRNGVLRRELLLPTS